MEPSTWQYMCQTGAAEFPGRSCSEDRLEAIAGSQFRARARTQDGEVSRNPGRQDGHQCGSLSTGPDGSSATTATRPDRNRSGGLIDEWHVEKRKPLLFLDLGRLRGRLSKTFPQLSIGSLFSKPLDWQSSIERNMSREFSARAPGKHRKRLYGKALRINYVPFVDQTEAG